MDSSEALNSTLRGNIKRTERERLKLQHTDQWRQLRDQELRGELDQWALTVQAW